MSLKFGTFMAPFHCPVGQDPTAAYERDLDVIRHMDTLGSGGFGSYLLMHHEWARPDATRRCEATNCSPATSSPGSSAPPAGLRSHGTTGCPAGPNSTNATAPRLPPPRKGTPGNAPNETELLQATVPT
jgi:hypothetical protein